MRNKETNYVKVEDCKHGYLYFILARNSKVGVYNEKTRGFIISRHKFGNNYLFEEYHWDYNETFGTTKPILEIEKCPHNIPNLDGVIDETEDNMELLEYLNYANNIASKIYDFLHGEMIPSINHNKCNYKTSKSYQVGGSHYTSMEIQPWDVGEKCFSETEYVGYHVITSIAYLMRHSKKNGVEDIRKAHHHLTALLEYLDKEKYWFCCFRNFSNMYYSLYWLLYSIISI